tara:strand:- start:345 stop:620 length:276 start_codon:yes stop_codon:yes gene_type:complete
MNERAHFISPADVLEIMLKATYAWAYEDAIEHLTSRQQLVGILALVPVAQQPWSRLIVLELESPPPLLDSIREAMKAALLQESARDLCAAP